MARSTIRTEVRELELTLDGVFLTLTRSGEDVILPMVLSDDEAERLRLDMAKALLPEWNQLEDAKTRATVRNRRYLGSWLVMCLAAFSAYVSYPQYFLCIALSALSIFLWWRAGYMEQKEDGEAARQRKEYRPSWKYLQERTQESDGSPAGL
jgi:hypothetical protein